MLGSKSIYISKSDPWSQTAYLLDYLEKWRDFHLFVDEFDTVWKQVFQNVIDNFLRGRKSRDLFGMNPVEKHFYD